MWPWDRRAQLMVLLLAAALVFAGGVKYARWQAAREDDARAAAVAGPGGQASGQDGSSTAVAGKVAVHVTGAVSKPGVYYLPAESRVTDAIKEAGPLPDADTNSLSLAQKLGDGAKIYVPRLGETLPGAAGAANGSVFGAPGGAAGGAAGAQGDKLNINTASAEELDARLPGIGPVLAKRIVDYRTGHGPFKSIEDLRSVSGIGPSRFDQIKDYVTI